MGSKCLLVACAHGVLQYVEFAGLEGDLDEEDGLASDNQLGLQLPNPNASKANAHPASSLEALLATKNKRILEELTKFRVSPCSTRVDL
jgi:homeobox protein cut-like